MINVGAPVMTLARTSPQIVGVIRTTATWMTNVATVRPTSNTLNAGDLQLLLDQSVRGRTEAVEDEEQSMLAAECPPARGN